MEPSPGLEPGTSFVPGTRSGHWSYEGMVPVRPLVGAGDVVRPPGLEPGRLAALAPRASVSAIPPRAHGAAIRCRPGSSAVRRPSRSRARRLGFRGWTRTSRGRVQSPAGTPMPHPEPKYGRRESNAQAAPFEGARSARLPSLPRAPPGIRTPCPSIKSRVLQPL